jgi:hypothetical protein
LAFAQMIFFIVEQSQDRTNGDDGLQSFPTALALVARGDGSFVIPSTAPPARRRGIASIIELAGYPSTSLGMTKER